MLAPVREQVLVLTVRGSLSQQDGVQPGGVDHLLGLHLLLLVPVISTSCSAGE